MRRALVHFMLVVGLDLVHPFQRAQYVGYSTASDKIKKEVFGLFNSENSRGMQDSGIDVRNGLLAESLLMTIELSDGRWYGFCWLGVTFSSKT